MNQVLDELLLDEVVEFSRIIGKPGVVREVDLMSVSYKYTVDLGYREIKLLEEMLEMIDE